MDRLPTEVFQHLLTIIFEEIRNGYQPRKVYPCMFELRLVSTAWMAAIDSHPSFWTLLTNYYGERLFSRVIERSGALPLDVDFVCYTDASPMWDIDAVVKVAPRWLSLHVEGNYYEGALKSLLATPAPHLREVLLDRATSIAGSIRWFDGAAPKLQTVIMDQTLPNWESLLACDLKRLKIQLVSDPQEKEFEGLLQVVSASSGLEELELYGWGRYRTPVRRIPSARGVTLLDRLRKVRLDVFPWQWAVQLLETIRIPHSCASNILVEVLGEGGPIDAALRLLKRELTYAETVTISLVVQTHNSAMVLTCTPTATAPIQFKVYGSSLQWGSRTGISQALSVMHGLKTPNQELGVPVDLSITRSFPEHMSESADQEFSSIMVTADPLFPSVTKLALDSSSQPLFLKLSNWSRFTNLSEIEIKGYSDQWLSDVAEWILERAALANSDPNVTPLKTVTLEAKYVQPEVIDSISNTLRDVVDLHWT